MGSCPRWYLTLRAARYLGVPPWELERQSILWRGRALMARNVEEYVDYERRKRRKERGDNSS